MESKTPCTVEIAHTSYDFYAHVELQDNTVGPGDQVLVHVGMALSIVQEDEA